MTVRSLLGWSIVHKISLVYIGWMLRYLIQTSDVNEQFTFVMVSTTLVIAVAK